MKKHSFIFYASTILLLLFFVSCNDKKTVDKKTNKAVTIQAEMPEDVVSERTNEDPIILPSGKAVIKKVIVKKGEWLYDISRREYGNAKGWLKIYNANKALIDKPDLIYPNQELVIP